MNYALFSSSAFLLRNKLEDVRRLDKLLELLCLHVRDRNCDIAKLFLPRVQKPDLSLRDRANDGSVFRVQLPP